MLLYQLFIFIPEVVLEERDGDLDGYLHVQKDVCLLLFTQLSLSFPLHLPSATY